ncbi:MAG: hypothetical protein HOP31_02290 [Ignavibacteria bacterium]|nr:hypothetical protein [Ignavibacteria bacterium]
MPFPLVAAGIAAGAGGIAGALSNIFGKDKKEWTDADLTKMGWKDYNAGEANNFLLRNAANLINRRKQNANAKAAQYGMDPVSSSYQMEDDIMDSVAGQAGDIYTKSIESSQNKAKLLTALNSQEEDDSDIFSDILSGAGLGLNAVSRFYKPMNTGGILPNDPEVPKNKDVYPTMLAKNEGVLNSEAMSLPGVKEFVQRANKVGLSLRSHRGSSQGIDRAQGMKDGGVIGEAKKEEKTKKKSRNAVGTSLFDRVGEVMNGTRNYGDLMNEVGYNTLHNLSSGNELPDNLDPKTMNLMNIINSMSTMAGNNEQSGDLLHRIEAGMEYNPMEGFRFKIGRAPDPDELEEGIIGVAPRTKNDPRVPDALKMKQPLSLNIHSHDFDNEASNQDFMNDTNNMSSFITSFTGPRQFDKNSGLDKDYDETGKLKKRRNVGLALRHLTY